MDQKIISASRDGVLFARARLWMVVSYVLTILVLVPFGPSFPSAGTDASWAYAMNVAIANHLHFGRDVIFTFGPLAPAYTHLYHPSTDNMMLVVSFIVASAAFAGFASLAYPKKSVWLIALPIMLCQFATPDGLFIFLPFLLLLVAERDFDHRVVGRVITLLVAGACALLPLIKGSLGASVLLCTGLALVPVWRRSRVDAVALVVTQAAVMIVAWLWAGQPLEGLPNFFIAQDMIISGYTVAMSLNASSNRFESVLCLIVAASLVWAMWRSTPRSSSWRIMIALSFVLFVCFKAAVVRPDWWHVAIFGSALVLVGYVILLRDELRRGVAFFAISIISWAIINHASYVPYGPKADLSRVAAVLKKSSNGILIRLFDNNQLSNEWRQANEQIQKTLRLPSYTGTADIYPVDLSLLFASDTKWNPRPIIQSYAAYTTDLARINQAHLLRKPPDRIYFDVTPTDGHYPSLEDGVSWPDLIVRYKPVGFVGRYTILEKRPNQAAFAIDRPVFANSVKLGAQVIVPSANHPIWAQIDINPTRLGKLASAVYKLPPLHISVQYSDGSSATYRFIPGMAKAGFLLSPTVSSGNDFVALQSSRSVEFFAGRYPISFSIAGESGARLLWSQRYTVSLSIARIAASAGVDQVLFSQPVSVSSINSYQVAGDCNIDGIDGNEVGVAPINLTTGLVRIRGWAMISGQNGKQNDAVSLAFIAPDGHVQLFPANNTVSRGDVAAFFHHPEIYNVGFEALIDANSLSGSVDVKVLQRSGEKWLVCGKKTGHLNRPGV
ncbi:hypothetical protein [Rhodanobacter terrae]|uniref:Transmembrane protein n=1 Tax=Rhodanobacter terrae TaxID=418647 RepID=A0ABW0T0G3_9GAMM